MEEPSVSSTYVMLNCISDDVEQEGGTQSFARASSIDKYKGKSEFKVNESSKYNVEGQTTFVTSFRDEN